MTDPTGESADGALRLDFDRRLMLRFRGAAITSDAGLLACRELDDALGLTAAAGAALADARTGKNGRHALVGLLRQAVFGRLAARGAPLPRQLQLPGRIMDQAAPGVGQGRVASWRTPPAGRLYCDQPHETGRERGGLLQPPRHGGAVNRGGQGGGPLDPAVVPLLVRQRRPAPAARARLQPRHLPADAGAAGGGGAVDADHPAGEAGQDRRQGGEPRPLRHLPDGRGGGAAAAVRGGAVAHRPAAGAAGIGVRPVRGGRTGKRRARCASMDGRRQVPAPPSPPSRRSTGPGSVRRRLRPNRIAAQAPMGGPCPIPPWASGECRITTPAPGFSDTL
jgi:hypothetical protein